jgi:DNA-binding NtrC family response regulator
VISLVIPPLKERREDIHPIARHLLRQTDHETDTGEIRISPDAINALENHIWQGNVRELSNVLDRAASSMRGNTIVLSDLTSTLKHDHPAAEPAGITSIRKAKDQAEKKAIVGALQKTGNNKSKAADLLGIRRTLLYKKMKRLSIGLDGDMG